MPIMQTQKNFIWEYLNELLLRMERIVMVLKITLKLIEVNIEVKLLFPDTENSLDSFNWKTSQRKISFSLHLKR